MCDQDALWACVAAGAWSVLLPGLADRAGVRVLSDRLADPDDPYDLPDLAHAAQRVGTALAGVEWECAVRLAATVEANRFVFAAWSVVKGHRQEGADLPRRLAAAYAFLLDGQDRPEQLDAKVWAVRPGWGPRPAPFSREQEVTAFRQAMSGMGRASPA